MTISNKYSGRYIFHFTDMSNLDSIIKNGLLCTNVKNKKGIIHKNIANMTIQERRANMNVPVGLGGKVHDYVPFYFSSINPMLLGLLNHKNVDQNLIIYLCVKIQRLEKEDAVFTDASANTVDPPIFYDNTTHLDNLDWALIDSRKWSLSTEEDKHKKMAEALIFNRVDISEIDAIVVYNDSAKTYILKIFEDNKIAPPLILFFIFYHMKGYRFYYTKFFIKGKEEETLVTGSLSLLNRYKKLICVVKKKRHEKKGIYNYSTMHDLIQALDKDISVIPELKDIEGILMAYSPHNETVDKHIKKVVGEMKNLSYYKNITEEKRDMLLLAAYLHDIGMGPKEKWDNGIIKREYLDHPADAIPMLGRILTEEIEFLSEENIRMICMLVIYHDIVDDCFKKGRDIEQIVELIDCKDDLDMLFAISIADAKAIGEESSLPGLREKKLFISQIMKMKLT